MKASLHRKDTSIKTSAEAAMRANPHAVQANLAKLPEQCYGLHNYTEHIIRLEAGTIGYKDPEWGPAGGQGAVDRLNATLGVNKAQAQAMLFGAFFGFHLALANPDLYDPQTGRRA